MNAAPGRPEATRAIRNKRRKTDSMATGVQPKVSARMWSKIDDKLHSSQQQRTAGLEAMGLWTLGESYCGDQLTDGFIPAWFVIEKCGKRKGVQLADRLVAAEMWEMAQLAAEKGWNSVGYLLRNKSREWVHADRSKTAKRQAEWRQRQVEEAERNAVSNSTSNAYPDQTRPDPTRSSGSVCPGVVGNSGTDRAREADSYAPSERQRARIDRNVRDGYER